MPQLTKPASPVSGATPFFGVGLNLIFLVFLARFIMDVGTRIVYPFIPQFSAGLGLTVVGFGWLLFLRSLAGVTGPLFGLLSDRYGRRMVMSASLLCQAAGVLGLAFSHRWWAVMPILLFGLSLAAFLPAQQAYISDQVPYNRRGRALGAVEFAWASVGIVALPVTGWLIDAFGWRSPFLLLSLLSLAGSVIVWWKLPPVQSRHTRARQSLAESRTIFLKRNVQVAILVAMLLFVAVDSFVTVWGIWLTTDFNLPASTLGVLGTGIAVAELAGSGLASLFIDRLGKKRGSGLGLALAALAFGLLPFTRGNLTLAVAALIVMGTLQEFSIVSLIPLYSEQVPKARGTVLALVFMGISLGSGLGSPMTTILWERWGLGAVCAVAMVCLLAAGGLMWRYLHET